MKRPWWKNELLLDRRPRLTIALMVLSVIVFVFVHARGDLRSWFLDYRLYPHRMGLGDCFKALLVHKSFLHLCGDMLFLWGLGFNFENRCGAWRFCGLLCLAGLIANGGHALLAPPLRHVAEIGLSGVLSFLLACYLVLFKDQTMYLLIDIGSVRKEFWVPPVFLFAAFALMQMLYGATPLRAGETGFYAHFAGFLGGLALSWPVRDAGQIKAYIQKIRQKKELQA